VLSRTENAQAIGGSAKQAGIAWLWTDLGSTKSLPARRREDILQALHAMDSSLQEGGRIFLHCSAGIHRTGMIAAALLFHRGHDEEQTRAMLAALRPLTASDVGEARLDWARSFS
jgi:protein tyrosine/serine phosphatase